MTTSTAPTATSLTTPQRDFFTALFDGLDGLIELRELPSTTRTFCQVGDEAAIAEFLTERRWENLYVGVATRIDATGGALTNCLALPALFLDLDFKADSEAESRQRLAAFPLLPSLVVASGGGLHAYWLLREPLDLRKDADRARALLRRFAAHLDADPAAAEPARILRVPDTFNRKYNPPRRVQLEELHPGMRYDLSDVERALEGDDVADFSAPFELPETIAEGQRNDVLYRYARSRKAHGDDESAVRAALLEANRTRCQPPLEEAEVERIAAHAMAQEDRPEFRAAELAKPTQGQLLLAEATEIELSHDPDGETAYATIRVNGHRQTWAIRSRGFRRWLVRRFYRAHGKPPTAQAVADALGVLEARAQFDGPAQAVHVRVAGHENRIYLDLANKGWEVVEVSPDGWRIVADPPVKFRRARGMRPLPRPVPGGRLDELRPFVNVGSTADWHLLVAWLVAAVRPQGPYPPLALHGEQGDAKSTTAEALRRLVEPNSAPLRGEPREPRDLMITASNSWMLVYDNLSYLPPLAVGCPVPPRDRRRLRDPRAVFGRR